MMTTSGDLQTTDLMLLEFLLDEAGIEHGTLYERAPAYHLLVTDGEHVFVKVTRPGEALRFGSEILGARTARLLGVDAPEPLLPEMGEFTAADGTLRHFTVWEHIAEVGVLDEAMVASICDAVKTLASFPPPALPTFTTDRFLVAIDQRLRYDPSESALDMLAYAHRLKAAIDERLDPAKFVLLHGDPHYDNVMVRDGKPLLVDWESVTVGPIEWDVAQLVRPHTQRPMDGITWESVGETVRTNLADLRVDESLLALTRAFRSVSHASYLHFHNIQPDVLAMVLDDLEDNSVAVKRVLRG
jgi:hypothetical protein